MNLRMVSIPEDRWTDLIKAETRLKQLLHDHPELEKGEKLTATAKRYKAAFAKFVERTDQVLSSPELVGIFQYAYVHGYKYTGPSLHLDIAAAKKQLGIK
jgi:predicted translin family RNA/ssDNA-binding protein